MAYIVIYIIIFLIGGEIKVLTTLKISAHSISRPESFLYNYIQHSQTS